MKIISFDSNSTTKIKRDDKQDGLFNLFQKNIRNVQNLNLKIYLVPREHEMRLDKISNHLYGTPDYVEELMVLNDIINPYSVKEGQFIYFCSVDDLAVLQTTDEMLTSKETQRQNIIKSSQPNREKNKTLGDNDLPPNIKPANLEQIKVKDNKVQIINSFK